MIKNCINCGAPVANRKCEYCGTEYNEKFSTNMTDDFRGTLTFKGQTFDVYMSEVEVEYPDFGTVRDFEGRLLTVASSPKRTFTLIEY